MLEFKHELVEQKHQMKASNVFFSNFEHWSSAPLLKSAWSHLLSQAEEFLMIHKPHWGVLFQIQLPKRDRNKFLSHFKGFTHLWHQWVLTCQCSINNTNVSLVFSSHFSFSCWQQRTSLLCCLRKQQGWTGLWDPHRRNDGAAGEIQL